MGVDFPRCDTIFLQVWIDVLVRAGVSVEVCHVDEEGKTKLKSGRNGKGKGKMIGKVGRPRKQVVIKHEEDELESEEQINLGDASKMSTSIFPRTHPETDSPSKTRRRVEIVTPSPSHKRRRLESDPS